MTESTSIMTEIPEGFTALLKIEGGEANRHQARAEDLVVVLNGMQKVAYLLASVDVGDGVKLNKNIKEAYALRCGVPKASSYALPMDAGIGNQSLLSTTPLLERIQEIFNALANQDATLLHGLLPTQVFVKALREIYKFIPRQQDGIRLSLGTRKHSMPVTLNYRTGRFIKNQLIPVKSEDTTMTVTGELQKIDFAARQVTIIYPPTRKEIICTYLSDIEDSILEARKEPIQVTGKFVLDIDGNPLKLLDVSRIEPLDLSPIVITDVELLSLRLVQPLELIPELDEETEQYLCVLEPSINLHAFALNRELLFDEVQQQLVMLWQEYALADDAILDDEALALKKMLLEKMEIVTDAKTQG